jgi:hypothetical protein
VGLTKATHRDEAEMWREPDLSYEEAWSIGQDKQTCTASSVHVVDVTRHTRSR